MRVHIKLTLMALASAVLLASAVGTASAQRFSLSENNIRVVFNRLILSSEEGNISCTVTMEGSFHSRVLLKTQELLGFITRAISDLQNCADSAPFEPNGSVLTETLPWHISNLGWTGTLPRIESILLLVEEAGFEILGIPFSNCDYIENIDGIATPEAGGNWRLEPDRANVIPSPGGFCPEGSFSSNNPVVTVLGGTTGIRVTLI